MTTLVVTVGSTKFESLIEAVCNDTFYAAFSKKYKKGRIIVQIGQGKEPHVEEKFKWLPNKDVEISWFRF